MLGYRVPKPDQVMLVSGRKSTEEQPFKLYRQGKFVLPGVRVARFLSLTQQKAIVEEPCTTMQGINGVFKAVVAFRIAPDDQSIYAAGQRFLDDQGVDRKTGEAAMSERTGLIFAGHLRSIVGAMTLEEIMQKRQALADQVLEASKTEVARMGLEIDSFQLTSITGDQVETYVKAMAAPHTSRIQQQASIAQAEADRASAEAQQNSTRQQAEYERDTRLKQAEYKAATDKADAEAAQAGPLADAMAAQKVLDVQRQQAEREAALKEQELITEIQRPAEAEATRIKVMAEADANRAESQARQMRVTAEAEAARDVVKAEATAKQTKLRADSEADATRATGKAEAERTQAIGLAEAAAQRAKADAMAANDRAQIELARIEQMPEIARALASGIGSSNLTILNGAEGVTNMIAGAMQQARIIFDTFKDSSPEPGGEKRPTDVDSAFRELEEAQKQ